MKKVILIYGLIAGTIVAAMMLITMPLYNNGTLNMDNGETIGYTTMVVALLMVFFGIKSYRDNHGNGTVTFGKAFKIGILITVIASLMYGLAWEVSYAQIGDEFMVKMTEKYYDEMKASGASEAELQATREQWQSFGEMYKNPVFRFLFTAGVEIFPVGLLITIVSSLIFGWRSIGWLRSLVGSTASN